MESLLSVAFDNLSSYSGDKIRKGLRQIEGMLAELCLAKSAGNNAPARPRHARHKSTPNVMPSHAPPMPARAYKQLGELPQDPAFREFFRLQDGFEWNVAMRLVNCLDRLMGKTNDSQNDLLILRALDLIQGSLLLHPPSRTLFHRETYMNHLLDLLEPVNCPAIQSATLLVLVTAMLNNPLTTRVFERLDGLLTVTSIFKSRGTAREVKLKLVEFLYFYLMPEVPTIPTAGPGSDESDEDDALPLLQRSPSKLVGAFAGARKRETELSDTLSTEDKQALLGRHLSSVEDLVADLRESTPFGGALS